VAAALDVCGKLGIEELSRVESSFANSSAASREDLGAFFIESYGEIWYGEIWIAVLLFSRSFDIYNNRSSFYFFPSVYTL
jgi:hypothetical protein